MVITLNKRTRILLLFFFLEDKIHTHTSHLPRIMQGWLNGWWAIQGIMACFVLPRFLRFYSSHSFPFHKAEHECCLFPIALSPCLLHQHNCFLIVTLALQSHCVPRKDRFFICMSLLDLFFNDFGKFS